MGLVIMNNVIKKTFRLLASLILGILIAFSTLIIIVGILEFTDKNGQFSDIKCITLVTLGLVGIIVAVSAGAWLLFREFFWIALISGLAPSVTLLSAILFFRQEFTLLHAVSSLFFGGLFALILITLAWKRRMQP